MRNPPILIAVIGFFAALAGFSFLFFGLRAIGFDWFGALGDLPAFNNVGLWGWLAVATGIIWLVAALGLWALQPWARLFAMIMCGLALLEAAIAFFQFPGAGIALGMALMPAVILWYLSTSEVKVAFGLEELRSANEAPEAARSFAASAPASSDPGLAPAAVAAGAVAASGATQDAPATSAPPAAPVAAAAVAPVAAAAAPSAPPAAPVAAAAAAPYAAPVETPAAPSSAPAASGGAHPVKIEDIEGIGPAYGAKLAAMGILTTDDLLRSGGSRAGRERIAEATGLSHALVLEWVNNADLMRIPGVGTQYSDLLEAAGVDSPAELAHRNAANLAQTVQEVVAARPGTVRRIPTEQEIAGWIEAAAALPRAVEH
jgi:predicted flap endonuclease-1-like 5' DNA nuclease